MLIRIIKVIWTKIKNFRISSFDPLISNKSILKFINSEIEKENWAPQRKDYFEIKSKLRRQFSGLKSAQIEEKYEKLKVMKEASASMNAENLAIAFLSFIGICLAIFSIILSLSSTSEGLSQISQETAEESRIINAIIQAIAESKELAIFVIVVSLAYCIIVSWRMRQKANNISYYCIALDVLEEFVEEIEKEKQKAKQKKCIIQNKYTL